jgi:hypothetical protein
MSTKRQNKSANTGCSAGRWYNWDITRRNICRNGVETKKECPFKILFYYLSCKSEVGYFPPPEQFKLGGYETCYVLVVTWKSKPKQKFQKL